MMDLMRRRPIEPVGVLEIAVRFGVEQGTVSQWRARSRQGLLKSPMPEPRWTVSGYPAWDWPEVESWGIRTRRLPVPA
jgi:transposase-like protein